jgi:hypothetical protein
MTDNITLPRATVQQVLEALLLPSMKTQQMLIQRDEAIIALRRALEQQAEPVAKYKVTVIDDRHPDGVPLEQWGKKQAQPPQRKPLTDEEIDALPEANGYWPIGMNDRILRLIRAAEAAHGIKEGT